MEKTNPSEPNFESILIVGGAGQIGQMFVETFFENSGIKDILAVVREGKINNFKTRFPGIKTFSTIEEALLEKPEAIIPATANPAEGILETIALNLKNSPVIILPQNGVAVVPSAQKFFNGKIHKVKLVRASLFTTIALDETGLAFYNHDKLRICLAPINGDEDALQKTKNLFQAAGFQTAVIDDYRSMEWTKLIVNTLGSSSVITGISIQETFRNQKLFEIEARAIKDRIEIMQAAGIPFAKIPWQKISLLYNLRYVPLSFLNKLKVQFANIISKGRNNQPPAAYRKILEGQPTEMKFYHQPFVDLAILHGLKSYLDETILEIIDEHESNKIDLSKMSKDEKLKLLFEIYSKYLQKPFIPRSPVMTEVVQKITNFFCREVKVEGVENLKIVQESLNKGKSVILLANHSSHADHPVLVRTLRESGFPDLAERVIFIAGMKFKNEIISRLFSDGYARVVVSTPSNGPQTEEENRKSQQVNLKGFLKINKLLNNGSLLVLYPEGTRSREGRLLKAIPSVARYFENANISYLLPVALQGTADLLPVGKTVPRFAKTTVTIDKPISPEKLHKIVVESLPEDIKATDLRDKNNRALISEKSIDYIMSRIASMLPPEKRGYYGK